MLHVFSTNRIKLVARNQKRQINEYILTCVMHNMYVYFKLVFCILVVIKQGHLETYKRSNLFFF